MQRWLELVTGSNSNLALSDLGIRVVAAMMGLLSWGLVLVEDDGGHVLGGTGRRRRIGGWGDLSGRPARQALTHGMSGPPWGGAIPYVVWGFST